MGVSQSTGQLPLNDMISLPEKVGGDHSGRASGSAAAATALAAAWLKEAVETCWQVSHFMKHGFGSCSCSAFGMSLKQCCVAKAMLT